MKKIILPVLLFCCISSLFAQGTAYFGLGYNMSFFQSDGLDFVVDRYNETRTYLDEPMPYCRYFDGLSLHFGGSKGAFMVDGGFTFRSTIVSASGTDASGIVQQRDLKDKWNTFDLGLGANIGASDNFSLAIGINTGVDSEKSLTRADTPDNIGVANFEKVNSQYRIGFEPFIQFIIASEGGVGLKIRPYYSFSPVTTDYYDLNAYINPYTYAGDPITIPGKLSGFGITLEFCYFEFND